MSESKSADEVRLWNENKKLRKQVEIMNKILCDIASFKNMTIYTHSEEFMNGANAGYRSCAGIAEEALKEVEDME